MTASVKARGSIIVLRTPGLNHMHTLSTLTCSYSHLCAGIEPLEPLFSDVTRVQLDMPIHTSVDALVRARGGLLG